MPRLPDYHLFKKGVPFYWEIPLDTNKPHLLCIGSSGSGKTYTATIVLAQALNEYYQATKKLPILLVADYKADTDFDFLEDGYSTFFRFDEVDKALDLAIFILEQRQTKVDCSKRKTILFIDEWGSYISSLTTPKKNEILQKLARLTMLGRSFNINLIISNQRGDAEYFQKVRDNFSSVLLLGTISKETSHMFLSDIDVSELSNPRGVGLLKISGKKVVKVTVPTLLPRDFERCRKIISLAVKESASLLTSTD